MILTQTTYDSTYIFQTRNKYLSRILRVVRPQNNRGPSSLPAPVGGSLDKSSITVKEVKGSRVGELRDNEGTLKASGFSMNAVLGGLRVGGINVIIVVVAGAVEQRLEVSRERHMREE